MIVPQHWAEGRAQHKERGRQVTVRRFGWSDASAEEAQANADARAQEALQRLLAGEKLPRRDPKVAYNGAAGVPIREEVLGRHGSAIITRNGYGARCLNTPDVLFADIDFAVEPPGWLYVATASVLAAAAFAAGAVLHSKATTAVLIVLALLFSAALATPLHRAMLALRGKPEDLARRRIAAHLKRHPEWALRLYRTPAGLRLLATHRLFKPDEPAVEEFFQAIGADPLYARMCRNQQCFRARLTAKPWRIGLSGHIKPRPGVWPINPQKLAERDAWIEAYERGARAFAACRYIEALGSSRSDPAVRAVQELHDRECSAGRELPLA